MVISMRYVFVFSKVVEWKIMWWDIKMLSDHCGLRAAETASMGTTIALMAPRATHRPTSSPSNSSAFEYRYRSYAKSPPNPIIASFRAHRRSSAWLC